MARRWLSDATRGPVRRVITIISLVAAGVALVMTVGMVVVALTGMSTDTLRICFTAWVLSLFIVFGGTWFLRVDEPPHDADSDR
jgi:hypothetical protein